MWRPLHYRLLDPPTRVLATSEHSVGGRCGRRRRRLRWRLHRPGRHCGDGRLRPNRCRDWSGRSGICNSDSETDDEPVRDSCCGCQCRRRRRRLDLAPFARRSSCLLVRNALARRGRLEPKPLGRAERYGMSASFESRVVDLVLEVNELLDDSSLLGDGRERGAAAA